MRLSNIHPVIVHLIKPSGRFFDNVLAGGSVRLSYAKRRKETKVINKSFLIHYVIERLLKKNNLAKCDEVNKSLTFAG